MVSIGGEGNQPSPHQRKLDNSEALIAAYKKRVGKYPAMPIKLAPSNGVPKGKNLVTFYRMAEQFGFPLTIDSENNGLPLNKRGYKQLLNTLASAIENGSGFLGKIIGIALWKQTDLELSISSEGTLKLLKPANLGTSMSSQGTLTISFTLPRAKKIAYDNPLQILSLSTAYESMLETINPFKKEFEGSLRNPTLTTEHEAVHNLLMGACREFFQKSEFTPSQPIAFLPHNMANSITAFYIQQLQTKSPTIMAEVKKQTLLTDYFTRDPQEFFTTLFEANASEIASRTTVTQKMAEAVGSTVNHLTRQKEAHLPTVSTEQREQLTALINLIKDTPFNLKDWWESQGNEFFSHLPCEDYSNLPKVEALAEHAHLLDLPKQFMSMLKNLDEKELMITMLHRLV